MQDKAVSLGACAVLCVCATLVFGARIRPGGDPPSATVIWADPFDNYSQWAYDNNYPWPGGPTPAGISGGYVPRGGTNNNGCAGSIQQSPAPYEMMRERWTMVMQCGNQLTKNNQLIPAGDIEAWEDPKCAASGERATTAGYTALVNNTWGSRGGGYWTSMSQFQYSFRTRIQQADINRGGTGEMNAVNGTDANPLVLFFHLVDGLPPDLHGVFDNLYVELSLGDDHAPTDYIWRGDPEPAGGAEYCPQGPYPIICQQVREVNTSVSEDQTDLNYLNANCPPLEPPYDPQTGQGRTWASFAFGMVAILDKDPCGLDEQSVDAHCPTMDHYSVFDGNKWRQIRASRYDGLSGLAQCAGSHQTLAFPADKYMALGAAGGSSDFTILSDISTVFIKIVTDYVYIYVDNGHGPTPDGCYPAWHAAIPRVYKGPFDTLSLGVGPGCELDSASYACKAGGTPTQCLMYSKASIGNNGYTQYQVDSMALYGGELVQYEVVGGCCQPNGVCVDGVSQNTCDVLGGTYYGDNSLCSQYLCCPTPFADTDADSDVDQSDFGAWQVCYTGQNGGVPAGCECLNRDGDGDIDSIDFGRFDDCWTGPNVPWSQGMTPDCQP